MMKAFSFLTILESLSKKLSILRTKMHSDNLRVDYESITSQLRVSRPFSHCASSGASLGTSSLRLTCPLQLRRIALILCVLVLSVGQAWGASPYNLDITSYEWGGTGNKSANDGTVTISGYIQSKTYNNTGSTKVAYLDGSNYLTISATSACITSITVTANTDNNSNKHEIAYQTSTDGSSWSASTNIGTCANRKSAPTSLTANFSPAVQYVRFTKGGSNSISVGAISITYTDGGGETPDPDPDQPGTGGDGDCYSNLAYSGEANMPTGWTIVSASNPKPQIKNGTIAMQSGSSYAYSSGAPTRGMYFDANQNATISITSYCTNTRAFCLVEKNGDNYSIIQTWDAEETLTAAIVSGRSYYLTSKAGSADNAKCNIQLISFSDCSSTPEPETYSINYECDGATSGCPSNATEQTALPNPLPTPIKTGYTFDGWYTDADKNTPAVAGATLTADITLYAKWNCTAPSSVTVTPTNEFGWRCSIGETISLTATAIGGSGNYTYQWQKYIGDTWTDIAGATAATYTKTNCTTGDGGSYRCVVSTGTNCSYESEGYFVRVFTLNGGYTTDGEWTAHKIVWTGENTGVVTLSLPVSETYYFKVTDNDGKWFGYGDASNYIIQPWQADCGTGNSNIRLFTGPAGDYKFTINIEHAQENSPYVNVKVDYPEVTHPVAGYAYINKWWDCYVHYWEGASNALTTWGSDPKINDDRYVNICGTDYWYFPVIETYTNFIAKDNAGNPANTTGDQSTTNHSGQNITHNGSAWVWQEFSTYSITFKGNGNTGGSMTNVTGITCGGSATLTQNAFTRTGYTFDGWATTADGDVAHADKATISNITSDITLYAKWNAITYNITFDKENGTGGTTQVTATYNSSTIASITNPTRECYTFEGWYSGENGTGSLVINTTGVLQANVSGYTGTNGVWIATENKTLYAKWTKNATTLLLQRTGSEATPAGGVAVGGDAGTLNCIAEQGTIASYQWKQNTRGSKDGAINAVGTGATTANFSPKPTAAGSYWYYCVATDECGNEVETTLSGCFLFKALYTVTFNSNNGSVDPTSATQSESGAAIILPTPTRSGYMFTGWYTAASGGTKIGDAGDSYIPTANITLYAQWEHVLVFNLPNDFNGSSQEWAVSSSNSANKLQNYAYILVEVPEATSEGSVSWKGTGADANRTLYMYTDGTLDDSKSFTYSTSYVSQTFGSTNIITIGGKYYLKFSTTADWKAANVKIDLTTPCTAPTNAVINGGGTYNSGSNITLTVTANNITNGTTTYTWYRSNLGQEAAITAGPIQVASTNNTYVINSCVQSDAQVYYCLISNGDGCNAVASTSIAINVVTTYTLTYDANAGTDEVANMPAPEQHTPGTYTLSDLVPTRTGYTFAGWNRNPEGTGDNFNAAAQFTTGALNETLYAKWTPEPYYINYYEAVGEVNDINGLNQISIVGAPTSYTILDEVTLPEFPEKDGYKATGWYNQWCVFEDGGNGKGWAGCETTTGHLAGYYGHANYIVKYTLNTPVTPDPGTLTALECGTLYKVENMVPSGVTLSETGQYAAGISENTKFEVIGDAAETSNASGTPEMKTGNAVTLDSKSFEAHMWMKGAANLTANIPTSRAIKFILSQKGTLTIYYRDNNNGAGQLKLIEEKSPSTAKWTSQTKGDAFGTSELEAGTYYIYATAGSTAIYGIQLNCVTCTTPAAPTAFAVGSITSNGATFTITDAANTNNYEIYYSTTSTAPTAETEATITTTEKTKAVTGLTAETTYYAWVRAVCNEENKSSWVAVTNNSFTTSAELTPGDCVTIFEAKATSKTAFSATTGTITSSNLSEGDELNKDGYKFAVKPNSSNALKIAPKAGETFKVGDKLTFVVYTAKDKEIGFVIGGNTYTQSVNKSLYYFEQELKETDITDGATTITFNRNSGDARWVEVKIERCAQLPSCTTPVLSDLENKKVCPGEAVSWTAIVNNTATLQENGETIAYQWNKKGNNTVLSNTATLTLDNVTEATGGTYVVTATVSADGKASKTASKEVTLTVTPATATPTITASASTIFAGNDVTLTASCVSSGVSYKWYTCNANGTNEQAIDGATNATYTLTEEEAGTYYYKVIVTGNGTNSCGDAEKVYTLVVSNSGETTCGEIKGQFTTGAYTFDTDFIIYGINSGGNLDEGASSSQGTRCGGSGNYFGKQRFVVTFPVDVLSFSFIGYQSNLRTVKAVKTTTDLKTADTEYTTITHTAEVSQEGNCQTHVITPETAIPANTFVWVELSNGLNISEICYVPVSTADCTDPQVTATVDNATVCEGTENVTFTATNYADGTTTFQWQKKDGNTWTNINGAISATYTISSVTTAHAGQYRVIAEKGCKRMSEEVKLTVLTAPTFNTFATTASVMKGNALAISDVQATGATGYAWYKSADNSLDAAEDTKVGTSKDLLLAAASIPEAADQTFYLFCVASNPCGSVTSNAITVTVTPFVEEECATKGNEGDREFGFKNTSCGQDTYGDSKTPVWKTSSRSKYLTYTAPEGRYFATAKVTVAHTGGTKCGYAYSTDGGTTWEVEELDGLSTTLTAITIELPANVNAFRISRNLTAQDGEKGSDTGIFYLAEACFTYENACTETTLTAGSYNNEYNISTQMDFVEPTFTLKAGETTLEGQTLTYTSSNTAIATVDEDGNVTFEGMTGTVTITATFAGGEINETEYCACQGSYTITVGCKDQAPKIVAAAGTNLNGCNNSITLEAKMQDGTAFADGTFQWYRDGEAIEGATSASYIVVRAGTYTVSRTYTCTTMSSNSAVVTNENVEPQVERLTPFQYYHVDKTYSNQMKGRHLFAVTSYGTLNGKRYHLTATRNGETLDLSSSTAFFTIPSSDNAVDTVMIDLNELKNKYAEGDEIVITCAPINSCHNASAITASITIHVIDQTPTLALICSGADGEGTRDTKTLVVGGDFLTGYNKADLCQQTGNKTFDPNTEWGFYTELKKKYIVTPVNGYAEFNKLNYEPFDILLLTDYPKASKSEAAATILDDMAALCDYRPLLSLKAHMVAKSPSKWAAKGFTTSPVVPATTSQYANIVCYAHPMFDDLDDAHEEGIYHDHDDFNQLVYKMLTGPGHESSKGLQGFELKDADNFVTIGLIHYNAAAAVVEHDNHTHLEWTPAADDRQLVAIAERQANIEARMILFAINCGAQSMQTPMGRQVLLTCLDYLLKTDLIEVADCRLTFDNGEGAQGSKKWENPETPPIGYEGTGYQGDGKWSTAANWGPEYNVVPGRNNDVRIAAPCTVDANEVEVLSIHITEDGSLTIPADKSLTARSTILRADEDGNVYPTNVEDISLGSNAGGNASLILNNERGDTKAGVAMYSTAKADTDTYNAAASTWQYIGTPHSDVQNAAKNYYDSWLYQYDTGTEGWAVIPNGGPLDPFRGYCITHPEQGHTYWMEGTLAATTNQDITIPAGKFVVVANSWTAPIQINELTDDDMEGLRENTIYFFNTGSDPNQEGQLNKENGRYAAGTYVSVPIHSAPYTGDSYIPSMQGFYVVGGGADGTLHLDYERHVRAPRTNTPSGPMHAPARRVAADNEPQVAKFLFRGTRYDDRLIILERPDFTRGYDSGWDGEQWGGNAAAPMSYVVTETRWDAVSAIPEYEGTVIAFRAGEDSEYTIHFDYDGMEDALYLLDTDTQIYTRVLKGNSYTFTCTDKAEHNRFILTRKAPQIATGTDHINTGENAKAVKFIKDDKIFIFVNGTLYDATGKMVIR